MALSLHEQRREVEALLASPAPVAAVFQPMMEIATGRVAGYEALARFAAPFERPPHLWFAQAHRCGLGAVLEACALRAALAVADRPPGTFLALNVSPAALISPEVEDALPRDLDGIVIELTEHEAFDEDGALELALTALRARGARIALDDAGAGYAGLQQLIRVRPDIVKVDRSLVAGIHEDASKLALLEALAFFATTTGAAVCAEGVEELTELRALAGVDVTYAQGYALARPGPAWPVIPAAVAAEAASADHHGMRISRAPVAGAAQSLAEMTDVLARARTLEELNRALHGVTLQLGAQEAALSRVDAAAGCLVTVSNHDWVAEGERFLLADYPTTAHVIAEQAIGQVIAGDPASDPAELAVLATAGMRAVLLMPLVHEGATIALLEVYRRSPQAWTNTQVDLARVLANHIATSLVRVTLERAARAGAQAGAAAAGAALAPSRAYAAGHARDHRGPRPGRLGAARRCPRAGRGRGRGARRRARARHLRHRRRDRRGPLRLGAGGRGAARARPRVARAGARVPRRRPEPRRPGRRHRPPPRPRAVRLLRARRVGLLPQRPLHRARHQGARRLRLGALARRAGVRRARRSRPRGRRRPARAHERRGEGVGADRADRRRAPASTRSACS